jgi:hypothetical protein
MVIKQPGSVASHIRKSFADFDQQLEKQKQQEL